MRSSRQSEWCLYPFGSALKSAVPGDESICFGGRFYVFSSAHGRGPLGYISFQSSKFNQPPQEVPDLLT